MSAFVSTALALPRVQRGRATCARRRAFVAPRMSESVPGTETDPAGTAFSGESAFASGDPAAPVNGNDAAADAAESAGAQSMFNAPSFDTAVFSEFVESAQYKVEELTTAVQEIDATELLSESKSNAIGLVDNFLAGDWLNRGELYGAVQLALVLLLLRSPGFLDGVIGFLVGPATLAAGAAISGKALWDLGRKQLSIWPAPVPDAELRTDGMYAYVRHPIYSGLLLASAGFAVSTGSPARFAIVVGMAAFLAKKIAVEEAFLADTYDGWADYVAEVQYRIIPKLW